MPEEPTPRIRPIWLVGGAAALTILAVCTLISVAAAIALIWFSSQISSNAVPTTQAVVQNPTQVAIVVSPTPLPFVNVPTGIPTIAAVRPSPDQAVQTYYQLVSQKRFDLSWPMLTDAFKQKFNCCAPSYDYAGYLGWWNSVNHVEFGTVQTVSQNGDQAVVYAQLYYVMNTGTRSPVDNAPYFELVYDSTSGTWRFNDKRATP